MTAATDVRRYDFHDARRLAPGMARPLSRWQSEVCTLLTEAWSGIAAHPMTISLGPVEPLRCTAAINQLPDPALGVLLQVGAAKLPTLLAIEPTLLHALFADLLGASAAEPAPDRPLSPLEDSLLELLLSKLREAISDAWPGLLPLPAAIKETCRPRRSRRLAQYEEVISVRWRIVCRFHAADALWLLPRKELEALLGEVGPLGPGSDLEQPTDLSDVVEQFPLDVTVELGQASVSTAALAQLQVGDVLILDQALTRPLTAHVGGEPVWLVEPRRIGQRQAVEIHSLLDG